jgi:hypothetical protein
MRKNLPGSLDAYFPEIDIGEKELASRGHLSASVSLYNHWLTEDEAGASKTICYRAAVEANAVSEYEEGEKRFLSLYQSLAEGG